MIRYFAIASMIVLLTSCSNQTENAKTGQIDKNQNKSIVEHTTKSDIVIPSIIGAWGNDEIGNAVFAFYPDSIYYLDQDLSYMYDIKQDTIVIYKEDGYQEKMEILKNTKDSLFLYFVKYDVTGTYKRRY